MSSFCRNIRHILPRTIIDIEILASRHSPCSISRRDFQRSVCDKNNNKGKNEIATSSSSVSSSYLNKFKIGANEWTKNMADSTRNSIKSAAHKASSSLQETSEKASETAQQIARDTTQKTIEVISKTASNVKEQTAETITGTMKNARQQLSEKASDASKVTGEAMSRSKAATKLNVDEAVDVNIRRPLKNATDAVHESSRVIIGTATSSGKRMSRWFWYWSLAAVFVYGVATTLPMAIIKYTIEDKKEKYGANSKKATEKEVDANLKSRSDESSGSGSWL